MQESEPVRVYYCTQIKTQTRELLYTIRNKELAKIAPRMVLYDLAGQPFRVKDITHMCYRTEVLTTCKYSELQTMIMLESLSGARVVGNILTRDKQQIGFIFCAHPLTSRKPDDDYQDEYLAVKDDFPCALIDYDALQAGKLKLSGKISGVMIYRGWMLRPEVYRRFYQLLADRGIYLLNDPEAYEHYHLLPNWYPDIERGQTPLSYWTKGVTPESISKLIAPLKGKYIVKDYVKSRKHERYDAAYIPDIKNRDEALRVINNFIHRQGESLVGGIVLRKFERLQQVGYHAQSGMPLSEEYRLFIFGGTIMTLDDYWLHGEGQGITPEERRWLKQSAQKIASGLVTLDVARRADGKLIIMEMGDGQVSGLQELAPRDFYHSLKQQLRLIH